MLMNKKKKQPPYPPSQLHHWFESVLDAVDEQFEMRINGCNAYLYVRSKKSLCCALVYGRVGTVWKELAIRQIFSNSDIPYEILTEVRDGHTNNITEEFRKVLLNYKKGTDEDMKDGTKKALQTALNVAANGGSIMDVLKYKKDPNNKMDGMTRAGEMARAALNQDWFDLARLGWEAFVDLITDDPLTYQEFLSAISQYIDAKIMQIATEENLRFVGGECHLKVIEEEQSLATNVQLYFKNEKNAWIKKELNGKTDYEVFDEETIDGEIANILMEGGRKFPITDPSKE